jgi:hypothetical protein
MKKIKPFNIYFIIILYILNMEKPIENKPRDHDCSDVVIITKHSKIIHKVYTKMNVFIKSAYGLLNESNYTLILTQVMRQLNKYNLYGWEKKKLAIEIMILLLDAVGCPDAISRFTAELTVTLIEGIYQHNMHRYKHERKCIIL